MLFLNGTQHMLTLYGTAGCHLCHDAQSLLARMKLVWCDVDIVDDDTLLERYGTRIPVLQHEQHELNWPFLEKDVLNLLAHSSQ